MYDLKITIENVEDAAIIIAIFDELKRVKEKHPIWPPDPVSRAAIVLEEAGEVIREANHLREGSGDVKALRTELIQTGATCIRMLSIMASEKINAVPVAHVLNSKVKGAGLKNYFPDLKD